MKVGEYDIPDNWESMTCIYNCGFILVWERGKAFDAGLRMDTHIELSHPEPSSLFHWLRFWRRDME